MSALGAFFRGAAGPGMLALADIYERRDREDKILQERRQNLEAEMAFRADQARQDRMARYGSDGSEPGMLAAGRRATSAGGGEGGGGASEQALYDYAAKNGVSLAQARSDFAANESGIPNRMKQVVTNDADRDGRDRRTGTGATIEQQPDWQAMQRVFSQANKALSEAGPRAKSNYAQLTEGDGNAQRNQVVGGMLSGALTPAETGEAVAATKGEGAYGKGGVNQFSGTPDAVGRSTIRENDAQAGSAGRANRDGGKDGGKDGKPDTAWLRDEYKAVTQAIATARATGGFDPKKDPQQQALLDRALDLEGRLSAAGQSVDDKAIAAAVAAQLAASKAATTQSDARKAEPKPEPKKEPKWEPDPNSPAGQQLAKREKARADAEKAKADAAAAKEAGRATAEEQAAAVLKGGNRKAIYEFQQSDAFGDLSPATKAKIFAAVLGR